MVDATLQHTFVVPRWKKKPSVSVVMFEGIHSQWFILDFNLKPVSSLELSFQSRRILYPSTMVARRLLGAAGVRRTAIGVGVGVKVRTGVAVGLGVGGTSERVKVPSLHCLTSHIFP